ncbi:hypothetical protein [Paenilisteria rocourtiae]|nr:hypothetical protein [Listeria rocourtiae]
MGFKNFMFALICGNILGFFFLGNKFEISIMLLLFYISIVVIFGKRSDDK